MGKVSERRSRVVGMGMKGEGGHGEEGTSEGEVRNGEGLESSGTVERGEALESIGRAKNDAEPENVGEAENNAETVNSKEVKGLSEFEAKALEFERGWWQYGATRDLAIRHAMGMNSVRYHLLLTRMLDQEHVWRADPVLVDRLRKLRDERLGERRGTR